jgi:hypothetical protein
MTNGNVGDEETSPAPDDASRNTRPVGGGAVVVVEVLVVTTLVVDTTVVDVLVDDGLVESGVRLVVVVITDVGTGRVGGTEVRGAVGDGGRTVRGDVPIGGSAGTVTRTGAVVTPDVVATDVATGEVGAAVDSDGTTDTGAVAGSDSPPPASTTGEPFGADSATVTGAGRESGRATSEPPAAPTPSALATTPTTTAAPIGAAGLLVNAFGTNASWANHDIGPSVNCSLPIEMFMKARTTAGSK